MKLINILRQWKARALIQLPSADVYIKQIFPLCVLALMAIAIWFGGPSLTLYDIAPIADAEKRIYVIAFLFLIWLLKFVLLDMNAPDLFHYQNPKVRNKLLALENRFRGALQFLHKTTLVKNGRHLRLTKLPWYLLIGPDNAGKTSLLSQSDVNFILQKRQSSSPHCDWWVTRDASIVDVPSHYFSIIQQPVSSKNKRSYAVLWQFLLRLIKMQRGPSGIDGIIIALPLPEIIKQQDSKSYQLLLHHLFQRLHELHALFPQPIPCQLVITKCDLLSGFVEFFAESGSDELLQAWGVSLTENKNGDKLSTLFTQRFDALIKKLNQQLLWRLHQERNPMARPYIKDFPLQVERIKEITADFLKNWSATKIQLSLQGVYLTSALQTKADLEPTLLEAVNNTNRAIQRFTEPLPMTRAYFIKHFLTHGLVSHHARPAEKQNPYSWPRYLTYTTSAILIAAVALLLGRDFKQGLEQTYALQTKITDYQLRIPLALDANEHLLKTLALLNSLQPIEPSQGFQFDLAHLMTFYSSQYRQKAHLVYHQALKTILLPEIANYLADYLKTPISKNADDVYAALKAYLMLGDASHFQAEYVANVMQSILPSSISPYDADKLHHHIQLALAQSFSPLTLDASLIQQTQRYFYSMQALPLSYIILKNIDNNNKETPIDLGTQGNNLSVFTSKPMIRQISTMFTANAFTAITSQQIHFAAQEAVLGNWVLGAGFNAYNHAELTTTLINQLHSAYINNYIETWEKLLATIHLTQPTQLAQADSMITHLISSHSPLLKLLQTLKDNTYFEPITSASPKLQSLGALLDKKEQTDNLLLQLFATLQSLHQHLQAVLTATNEKKAAFEVVSSRMQHQNELDAITQLRMIAVKSPEPMKTWLEKMANDIWHLLMQDAAHYLDTAWQNEVAHIYQNEIAHHYPFDLHASQDVDIEQFIRFFGKPGIAIDFYQHYLQPFIDTSSENWRWKTADGIKLPFAEAPLQQIQYALRIHQAFFPKDDNQLSLQFALKPYQFSKNIKRVKLNISNQQFIDQPNEAKSGNNQQKHLIAWPMPHPLNPTTIQLTLANKKMINYRFPGDWGWFKLVNQAFESLDSKKQMVINLSLNGQPAKYLLLTDGQFNPFISLNLRHFHLDDQLISEKTGGEIS